MYLPAVRRHPRALCGPTGLNRLGDMYWGVERPAPAWGLDGTPPTKLKPPDPSDESQGTDRGTGHSNDPTMDVADVSSEEESIGAQSQLESDTRYLPLQADLSTMVQALHMSNMPQQARHANPQTSFAEIFASRENAIHASSAETHSSENQANSSHHRRLAANFAAHMNSPSSRSASSSHAQPITANRPHSHAPRSASPLARSKDLLEDGELEGCDSESSSLELKLLKAILASRKTKKTGKRSAESSHEGASRKSTPSESRRSSSNKNTVLNKSSKEDQDLERTMAATKLQALWRGFVVRHKDPSAKRVCKEIRSRRAEHHIQYLSSELTRQRHLYEQEKQLRLLQLDAVRMLWKEVQSLQTWKEQVLQSQELVMSQLSANASPNTTADSQGTKELLQALEKASSNRPLAVGASLALSHVSQGSSASSAAAKPWASVDVAEVGGAAGPQSQGSQKEVQLESACKDLQKQVWQLQAMLSSVSHCVFQGSIISAQEEQQGNDGIRLSSEFDDDSLNHSPPSDASLPTVIAQLPAPGIATAPSNLRAQPHAANSLILRWEPSQILETAGKQTNKTIQGYRLYINDRAKGMITGTQTKALLEGLDAKITYRVFLRATTAVGESASSNVVEIPGGMVASSQPGHASGHEPDPPADGASHPSSPHGTAGSGPSQGESSSHREAGDPSHDSSHQGHHRHSGSETRMRAPVELRQKRSSSERLEQKVRRTSAEMQYYMTVEGPNEEQDSVGVYRAAGEQDKSTLSSSPRIQEGLIKRLDQVKEKGKLGELKFAAKIHKRKPSPESPTPMRAMAKEERDAASPYKQPVDVTEEEVALAVEKSYFKRQNSLKYRKKRASPPTVEGSETVSIKSRGIPARRRTDSGSENEEISVNSQARSSSHKEPDVLVRQESLRRRHRTPSSGSGSDIGDGDHASSRLSHKSSGDSQHSRHHGKPPSKDQESPLIARYSRGRSSARERVASKEYITEKRSSSVGAVEGRDAVPKGAVVKDKPPLAKGAKEGANMGHKEKQKSPLSRGGSKDESSRGRMRTKSESQASSEDDDSGSQRTSHHGDAHAHRGRHTSGGGSSSSEHEGRSEKPDAKAHAQKKSMFKHHKRSSSDLSGIPVLPDRPESPAPKERRIPSPSAPQKAASSPRVRRSSSFSKGQPDSPNKDGGEALLRQNISLEVLKAAKSQDPSQRSGSPSPVPTSSDDPATEDSSDIPSNRINAKTVIRRSMERLYGRGWSEANVDKPSDSTLEGLRPMGDIRGLQPRGRSMSFGTPVITPTDTKEEPPPSNVRGSNTAPAVLLTEAVTPPDGGPSVEPSYPTAQTTSGPAGEWETNPITMETTPASSSTTSNRVGSKAADLFARLQLKLSSNKT